MREYATKPRTVYVLRVRDFEGPYKIGATDDIDRRLCQINNASPFPLELIASIRGNIVLERRLHAYARPAHLRCEWFAPSPEVSLIIAWMKSGDTDHDWLPDPIGISGMIGGTAPHAKLRPDLYPPEKAA